MGREPQNFSIRGMILRIGAGKFQVTIRATSIDHAGPDASFVERAECATEEEAQAKQLEMVREMSARLAAQGNIVVTVDIDS